MFMVLVSSLDEQLSCQQHIVGLLNRHRSSIIGDSIIQFLQSVCSTSLLRTLYLALISFILQYGLLCLGGPFKTLIGSLRVTQNDVLRVIIEKAPVQNTLN